MQFFNDWLVSFKQFIQMVIILKQKKKNSYHSKHVSDHKFMTFTCKVDERS